jgi:hypothetical protein
MDPDGQLPQPERKAKIVIGIDDLAEQETLPEPPYPPVDVRPDAPMGASTVLSRSGYNGPPRRPGPTVGDAAVITGALLVKLVLVAGVALFIVGFVYGGSADAHRRCFAHRLSGDSSLTGMLACAVER